MNGRGRFSGGRYHQKSPNSNMGGRGGARAPPAMEVERRGVGGQFQQKLFEVQYTIDCEKEKFSHPEGWQHFAKNENFTEIDQNSKKHEKR